VAALLATHSDLRTKSRDLVRRNAWAQAGIEAFVANAVGTGIKPQSLSRTSASRHRSSPVAGLVRRGRCGGTHRFLWPAGPGLPGDASRWGVPDPAAARRPEDGLTVPLQLQLLEPSTCPSPQPRPASGNEVRAGIEFDALGRRVAYHLYRSHPEDGRLAPMSGQGGLETVRIDAREVLHLFRVLRPGQIRGEPWLARALVKLNELDQYDDAELVRKKTAAMFAGSVTRQSPEDALLGEGPADGEGVALAGLEPGTLQILEPGKTSSSPTRPM